MSGDYETAIAIIGMAGRFPGARDVQQLWLNVVTGVRSIRSFSDVELLRAGLDQNVLTLQTWVRAGSILDDVERFDATFFGYSPREAETIDPQHRLLLEQAWVALEDAGYSLEAYVGRIGVFAGSGPSGYKSTQLLIHPEVVRSIGELEISIGNDKDALASTISYKLNLKGPSLSVQTFCSTSLVAVHLACQSLLTYECDLALAGGVAVQVPQGQGYEYQEGGILSPDGRCRTFDARARGSVMGSGVGLVVLKRLDEALRDGDQVYAVIRGTAINNDGGVRAGYTAPAVDGQAEVITEALAHAEVEPETIGYIEAHGTATPLGDAVELAAMIKAFRGHTERRGYCAIGSIKPNVGHLDRAAGVTGLIKAVQALRHRRLPPQIDYEQANPEVDLASSPFYVNITAREWQRQATPRRAGVSSFGLGGTNAHVVLEEAPEAEPSSPARPWELLVVSAKTSAALDQSTKKLAGHLAENPSTNLADVAYTLQVGRCAFNHRRIVVCRDPADAASVLMSGDPQRMLTSEQVRRGRPVAFMFPGLGDQYVGMAREIYQTEPAFRAAVDECSMIVQRHLGIDLRKVLYPEETPIQALPLLSATVALPGLFSVEYGLAKLLITWGVRPSALLGYSLGEYVAATLGETLSLEESLGLCCGIAREAEMAPPGEMLAAAASVHQLEPLLCGADIAATNAHGLSVVSGTPEEIMSVEAELMARSVPCRRLAARHAFHSRAFTRATRGIVALTASLGTRAATIPIFSSAQGGLLTNELARDRLFWSRPVHDMVKFSAAADKLLTNEDFALVELGPGPSLTSFVRQNPRCTSDRVVTPALSHPLSRRSDAATLLEAVGKLWLAGVNIEWTAHHSGLRKRVSLPSYPFERQRHWLEPRQGHWEFIPTATHKQVSPGKIADISAWTFQPVWSQAPLPKAIDSLLLQHKAPWLLIIGNSSIGEEVTQSLRAKGCSVTQVKTGHAFQRESATDFRVRLSEYDDWCRLLSELDRPPRTIVHFGATGEHADSTLDSLLGDGFYSVLAMTQAIERQLVARDVEFWSVSANGLALSGSDSVRPAAAALLGTARVIPQEILSVRCAHLDIQIDSSIWQRRRLTDQILAEFSHAPCEQPVALRNGERWLRRLEPLNLEPSTGQSFGLRLQGVYIITGGFGAVARVLSSYLASNFRARIVLVARNVPPSQETWSDWLATHPPNDPTSLRIRRVQDLTSLGAEVMFLHADVTNESEMRDVSNTTKARFGAIDGVFHAAGSSDPEGFRPLRALTRIACEQHFGPKLRALTVLERVFSDQSVDFVVLFSSLASILGGLGFAAYAGANAAMDSFAASHTRSGATPWVSVNWDTWLLEHRDPGELGRTIAELTMNPQEVADVLERILAYMPSQIIVSTGDLEARFHQWVRINELPYEAQNCTHPRPELVTAFVSPRNDIETQICEMWTELFGLERVGVYDDFFELGGHSLMATRLIGRLRRTFRLDIPLTILFDAPTVGQLAEAIEHKVLEEVESITEEQAVRLRLSSESERLERDDAAKQ